MQQSTLQVEYIFETVNYKKKTGTVEVAVHHVIINFLLNFSINYIYFEVWSIQHVNRKTS
jgi:hypothetical protein